jgi:hypothetical protein
VEVCGVRDYAIKIKEDRVVLIAIDALALWLPHELLSFYPRTRELPPRCDLIEERSVPGPYSRYFAVVAQHAKRARIQQKVLTAAGAQPDPARREHAQHMSVRKQHSIAVDSA